jgi:hypothetical protein
MIRFQVRVNGAREWAGSLTGGRSVPAFADGRADADGPFAARVVEVQS